MLSSTSITNFSERINFIYIDTKNNLIDELTMYSKKIIEIYSKVCDCSSPTCAGFSEIYNCPSKGSPPRGFFTESQGQIEILVVGKNPGHVLESESKLYLNLNGEELVKAHLDFSKKTFNKLNELNKKER